MVLFKCCFTSWSSHWNFIYIPLWSYSNNEEVFSLLNWKYIYIPLWSYSNLRVSIVPSSSTLFTFHYGPIHINIVYWKHYHMMTFTFHYGPIQIILFKDDEDPRLNLHSTMVLFKSIKLYRKN